MTQINSTFVSENEIQTDMLWIIGGIFIVAFVMAEMYGIGGKEPSDDSFDADGNYVPEDNPYSDDPYWDDYIDDDCWWK